MSTFAEPHWGVLPDHEEQVRAVRNAFIEKYGQEPDGVWSAPGRLNLLGEYIDFLGGSCMPMPLPYRTYIAGKMRSDGVLRAESLQMPGDERTVVIRDIEPGRLKGWFTYVAGVAWSMNQEGGRDIALPKNFGADLVIDSRVPVGGGLSSSAALECSTALALLDLSCPLRADCETTEPLPSDCGPTNDALRARLAQVCIRAENDVAGARTGGLDQTTSLRSKPGKALLIDFRDFSIEPIKADLESAELAFLVINTNTPHELAGGEFAARRAASEACAEALGLHHLRDALPEDLRCATMDERQAKLWRLNLVDETTTRALDALEGTNQPPKFPRGWIRHVFHDMALVERAAYLLKNTSTLGQPAWVELGHLFTESFVSMRDELCVSRAEIDLAVQTSLDSGALGARIVGGGFGGAVMALVKQNELHPTSQAVANAYAAHGYAAPEFLPMVAGFAADKDL
ncbi:galactokinase family protein [Rothia sp. LK2588]|uniref:galactokinase n=1 Tax=Rothia sp. LK2588 TaxID=3114369 RepID=UPI0034CFD1BA